MTDLENNLEEVWREEFESLFNEKYNKVLCGYTLKQWTTQERIDQERELSLPYYVEARKKAQEDIEFWKNEYVSHSETMCKCQQELQKTREHLGKAIKSAEFFMSHADCKRDSWACKCSFCRDTESSKNLREARQYFQDKDKQGE